ncbi:hypothetical protein C2G38_2167442 [Gigaspora rosea]|uniref:Transmembrane protein n=1 Tax=Gigaspora rosea TaxID=44941 RepID=A0A397VSX6_9GLOM|nr:hypothetical protein C2G38_2167442 [Gigaspora rosea]
MDDANTNAVYVLLRVACLHDFVVGVVALRVIRFIVGVGCDFVIGVSLLELLVGVWWSCTFLAGFMLALSRQC